MVFSMGVRHWFLVFFSQQKTAYEMRISDWSSDVCSSDLAGDPAAADRPPFGLHGGDGNAVRRYPDLRIQRLEMQMPGQPSVFEARHHLQQPGNAGRCLGKIGRAPSRERVCPYV